MSRNTVELTDRELIITPHGLDKLWSFTKEIRVPLKQVRGATYDPGVMNDPKGLRAPGLNLFGKKISATYCQDGERHFWNVSGAADVLVIELDPSCEYTRLMLSVEDPVALEQKINEAVSQESV